jgi:F-type H+-transporting ATPase subunit a
MIFGGLFDFFKLTLGGESNARKYMPFVGSLFLFILMCNYSGLIPFLKAPTAHFWTTAGLALCVFLFVNYQGIKEAGVGHYFYHMCGNPQGVAWAFAPLIFVLELIGVFVKPLSLALRLAGNIFGEDMLLASFLGMGVLIGSMIFSTATPPMGLPLHIPFLFLSTLLGLIQALVFSLLSAVYIALLLPHEHHDDEHGDGQGHEAHAH